jgi:hypothetical protein
MKAFLCAWLLASLQSLIPARAYESDIHYSTTYVLARAVGWTEAEAAIIAGANQGVDENQDTVAALEVDTTSLASLTGYLTSSLRQADKNLRFHCFSKTRGQAGEISADVHDVMSAHFAKVPRQDLDPRRNTRRLVALGVALHCQQDAHAHVDFGGSCGAYPGSCYGHTHETFIDQVIFRVMGKHYFNPDHPGVSGEHLLETLQGTVRALSARRPRESVRSISARGLAALSDALRNSGLELPDAVRIECNRHIAGKWLFDRLSSGGRTHEGTEAVTTLARDVALTCRNPALASARIIRIPEPRFPRLNSDGSPYHVDSKGSYDLIRGGSFEDALPSVRAAGHAGVTPHPHAPTIKVQLSHWSQILALPRVGG